jgi:hypothetical protein
MTTIIRAIDDENLFGLWFRNRSTWTAWIAFLHALFALPMTPEQLDAYRRCTGRTEPPIAPISEAWLACGRRAGKSFIMALLAAYFAVFREYRPFLAPGERGTLMVIAVDRRQARVVLRYIRALLQVPMLRALVERETAESFDLTNAVTIEVHVASFRSTRGYTLIGALCDEIAYWPSEDSSEPDYEILAALRPGMATIPSAVLLCASSPYARRGALWDAHRRHFGKDGDPVLVWQADTRTMNPSVPQAVIDEAMARDSASALAEYGAQFRTDVESFVAREAVEACIAPGVRERPPSSDDTFSAFCDPSGGSSDSMTLAVGHRAGDVAVLDCVREVKPPFSPESVCREFARVCKSYGVTRIYGDRYAGEWPVEQFRKHDVTYDSAQKVKSIIYSDFLPLVNSRRVDLLDHPRLVAQLSALERRTARGGRDSIDHPPGAHDDVANAVAGCLTGIVGKSAYDIVRLSEGLGEFVAMLGGGGPVPPAHTGRRSIWGHPALIGKRWI